MKHSQSDKSIPTRRFQTVKQFVKENQAFTEGGTRFRIFNAKENGLAESGAIVRDGSKILINPEKWFDWLESKNPAVTSGGAK